jgi:hypothetical protein
MATYVVTRNREKLSGRLTNDTRPQGVVETVLNQILESQGTEQIGDPLRSGGRHGRPIAMALVPTRSPQGSAPWCSPSPSCATGVSARLYSPGINVASERCS